MPTITALVSHTNWDEDRTVQTTPRVTPAHVTFASDDIKGTIQTEYLMTYLPSGNAEFIFTETVAAKDFLGAEGSFITQGKGTFDGKAFWVSGTFEIVEGSGTEGLEGITGSGKYATAEKGSPKVRYEFVVEGIKV